ncbi:hypothetical protein LJC55_00185 [Eubacteriales bacterium OttesenSCG-928-N14]|nr:hypothetical protein [Eubacteriales bacterium OttesenSCG-928-N14]
MAGKDNDYTEQNLVKLYELEKEKAKLDQLVEELYQREGKISNPEILMQSGVVQAMINEQVLGEAAKSVEQDEPQEEQTQE